MTKEGEPRAENSPANVHAVNNCRQNNFKFVESKYIYSSMIEVMGTVWRSKNHSNTFGYRFKIDNNFSSTPNNGQGDAWRILAVSIQFKCTSTDRRFGNTYNRKDILPTRTQGAPRRKSLAPAETSHPGE